ncbi:MAG TPA: hypothetical protein DCG49_11475 [Ruminococcus sp.]|nr:hypothetical protein [Ruminococcus sp.]
MRYMLCYATRIKAPQIDTEYFEKFSDAVMKYTVLCSNCYDVVLADLESEKIIRHFSYRYGGANLCITNN